MIRALFMLLAVIALIQSVAFGQEAFQAKPYDKLQASQDAYEYHEALRRAAIDHQLDLLDWMKWYAGVPQNQSGIIWYRMPPSLDHAYAMGARGYFSPYRGQFQLGGAGIFEPWPTIPGDIWGFPFVRVARQPIGQRHIQTGPNRWESHPVYLTPPGAPPEEVVPEPGIGRAINPPAEPPAKPKPPGPREF